jgi:GNAT superfamily N-acetyltransferase
MKVEEAVSCEAILRALPDWFGIERSIVGYRHDLEGIETYVVELDGSIAGFLTINQHNSHTAEIQVMAVRREHHRQGIGRALVRHAEQLLIRRNTTYLEVKTLGPSHPDQHYARTRYFYLAMGFLPVEENNLWGSGNSCLIMIKHLVCA